MISQMSDSSAQPLRIGVIGCGRIAQRIHIPNLRRTRGALVTALCDTNKELMRAIPVDLGTCKRFEDYHTLIGDPEVDAIMVLTPPDTHFGIVKDAIESNKHIFVEKPMTLDIQQAEQLVSMANDNQTKLMVGFMRRFDPAIKAIKQSISSGFLGNLITLRTELGLVSTYRQYTQVTDSDIIGTFGQSPNHRQDLRTFLFNQLIHHADLVGYFGGPVKRVHAAGTVGDEFNIQIDLEFADGKVGTMGFFGFLNTLWHENLYLHGSKGSASVFMSFPYLDTPSRAVLTLASEGVNNVLPIYVNTMYRDEIQYFVDCVRNGVMPSPGPLDSLRAQLIIESILKSLSSKNWS
jgi:myo-inositol 2-dehydrogenase/D-chiro-inositol 1-dehydrogenase